MARERMVTRTIVVTEVEVMCLNVTNAQVEINTYELIGTYADKEVALKQVKKLHEDDELKCVAIQEMEEKEILYGMKEIDFIQLAKVLPPRGTKEDQE